MKDTPQDFLGNEIKVGDEVVYMQLQYRSLKKGIITKITKHTVVIDNRVRQFHCQIMLIHND